MSDTQLIEERLRGFPSRPDDSDWSDVLRRAATSPATSSRLIAVFHRRNWSRRLALGGAGALVASGALAAVLVVVFAGSSAPNAFAGWKATPTPAASGQTATALSDCTAQLGAASPAIDAADWQTQVTDTRGPFSAMILQAHDTTATCLSGPSFTTVGVNAAPGEGSDQVLSIGGSNAQSANTAVRNPIGGDSGPIITAAQEQTTLDGQPYTLLQGRVDSGVTDLTLNLSDGSHVQATLAAGAFVAWWPSHATASSAQETSHSGITSQQLAFTPKSSLDGGQPTGQAPNRTITKPFAGSKQLPSKTP